MAPTADPSTTTQALKRRAALLMDPDIDRTSSFASLVISESYADTVFGPSGQPELHSQLPTAVTRVDLGFDQYGSQLASLGTISDPDPDLQGAATEHVRVRGATHQELDANWQPLPVDPLDPETSSAPPLPDLDQMPSLVPYFEGQPMATSWFGRAPGALAGRGDADLRALAAIPERVALATTAPGRVVATQSLRESVHGAEVRIVHEEERRLVADAWELARRSMRVERVEGGRRVVSRHDMHFSSIVVHRNHERDATRARALAAGEAIIAAQAARLFEARPLECQPTRVQVANPLYTPPICPPPEMEPPPPPPAPEFQSGPKEGLGACGLNQVAPTHQVPDRPGVLLLHGLDSSACTWRATSDTLRRTMQVPALLAGSTNARGFYDAQATQAATFPGVSPHPTFVAVGHSNGGVVGRVMLQQAAPRLAGVVTLNSPHRGAGPALLELQNVWDNAQLIGMGLLGITPGQPITLGNVIRGRFLRDPISRADDVRRIFAGAGGLLFGPGGDVLEQMAPGSARLTALNGAVESFPRAAIWTVAPERMLAFRLLGELGANGDPAAGDQSVRRWDRRKRRWRRWGWIGVAAGAVTGQGWIAFGGAALLSGSGAIDQINRLWPVVVRAGAPGPDLRSDGVVTASSQQYPGVPLERLYFASGPTHFSTLRRTESMAEVRRALRQVAAIPCKSDVFPGCEL